MYKRQVTATCDGNLTELVIDPSIINPSDSEFLQELLLQTINAAIASYGCGLANKNEMAISIFHA